MDESNYIDSIVFNKENYQEYPIQKIMMDDGWFCHLKSGSVVVDFNYKKYNLNVNEEGDIYFYVNEGIFFSIDSGSDDYQLEIKAISHTCLTRAYPYLGSDANIQICYSMLIKSSQMEMEIRELFVNSYKQLQLVYGNRETLGDYEKMAVGLLVHTLLVFSNAISMWREKQGLHLSERLGVDSKTQSYQIMNNLALIFDEPEAIQHREVQYYADRLNISVRYFFNVCIQETGMTPKKFINDIIVSDIKHTLMTTNLSLQQLTLKYAFSDQSALTQYFRRNTGMTPTEFRICHR